MRTTRFAPSPTGYLHLGHVYAAMFARHLARRSGGRFLLRLEDIDPERCRPWFAAAILEDLHWLGLDWDGEVLVQSGRLDAYAAVLHDLAGRGLVYRCFCSRAEVAREAANALAAPHGPDGTPVYTGRCRGLSAAERAALTESGAPHVLRLDMARALADGAELWFEEVGQGRVACAPGIFGDVLLRRRDGRPSYHLCVTQDDAEQGVTLVTRAVDLKPATGLHVLLRHLMGWDRPRYAHHRLLCGANGKRLSKRDGALSVRALREAGHSPAAVLGLARASR